MVSKRTYKTRVFPLLICALFISCNSSKKALDNNLSRISDESETDTSVVVETIPPKVDYFKTNYLRVRDHHYHKNIKTSIVHPVSAPLSFPIMELNEGQQLVMKFDEMGPDIKTYHYKIIHCNADWTPSDLTEFDYLSGFPLMEITTYAQSAGPYSVYTNYQFRIPNTSYSITKSGNYLVHVYLKSDSNEVVLTRRFMVVDHHVSIKGEAKRAIRVDISQFKQRVDFTLNHHNYKITDYGNLKALIFQNNDVYRAVGKLKPSFINNENIHFEYADNQTFWGGKEFRHLNIADFNNYTERVSKIRIANDTFRILLKPDEILSYKRYLTDNDINGNFYVKVPRSDYPDSDANYAEVTFELNTEGPVVGANLYLFGGLSNWQLLPEYRMTYDDSKESYTLTTLLKQGYYDYRYLMTDERLKQGDVFFAEGSSFETENDYTILIYYRPFGEIYDHLIGYKRLNTLKKTIDSGKNN